MLTASPVFLAITFLGVFIVIFFLPETKGLALEEIGALFGDEVALDLSHLTLEQREVLDRKLMDVELKSKAQDGDKEGSTATQVEVQAQIA